jgi:four helix bundle protein
MRLAAECDAIVLALPKRRPAGLSAQIARAAGSVVANIAEGCGRRSRPDFRRHLSIANGSRLEVETHVLRAAQIGLVKPSEVARVLATSAEVGRLLSGLTRWLESGDRDPARRRGAAPPSAPGSDRDSDRDSD